ncbi:MAG: glycosyltransferase [Ruminococcus sp.]|nr:glycosyltransferase [Ruminococcus sp.]
MDSCKCDYFMFLDADDCLYAPNVVKQLSEYIDSNNFDYVISSFVSETEDGKYVLYKNNTVWMHGKIFRTSFIQSENIRYSHTRLNEDHSFNAIVIDNPRSKGTFVDLVSYVWKYNKNSLVRSESFESYTNKEYVKNAIYTLSEFISRGYDKEKTKAILLKYLISFYAYFLKDLESGKDADILDTYLNDVRGFWSSIPESYKDICINDFQQFFYHDETIRDLIRRDYIFEITFSDFLKEAFNFNLLK